MCLVAPVSSAPVLFTNWCVKRVMAVIPSEGRRAEAGLINLILSCYNPRVGNPLPLNLKQEFEAIGPCRIVTAEEPFIKEHPPEVPIPIHRLIALAGVRSREFGQERFRVRCAFAVAAEGPVDHAACCSVSPALFAASASVCAVSTPACNCSICAAAACASARS